MTLGACALASATWACSGSTGSGGASSGSSGSSGSAGSGSGSSGSSVSGSGSSGSSGSTSGSSGSSGSTSGSSGSSGSSSGATSDAGGSDGSTALGPYPSGPYCAPAGIVGHLSPGCILPNMTWIGYVDDAADAVASTKPYVTYSLDDVRKAGKKYAMINVAELSCPGCQKSAGEIRDGGAAVVQAGGVVVEVLMTAGFTTIATRANLDSWVGTYKLPVTTVKDPDSSPTASNPTPTNNMFGRRDQAYIVELPTMKVLQYINGDTTGFGTTSGSQAMTAMHTLLGK